MRDLIFKLRANWLLLVLALLALKALQVTVSRGYADLRSEKGSSTLFGWDTTFYYVWLRSAVLDYDVDFTNDIELSDTLPVEEKLFALEELPRTEKGLPPNKYPIGWAVFHAPWFLAGHGTALVLQEVGAKVRADGYGNVYEIFVFTGSLSYAALSLWLSYLLLRRFFQRRVALASLAVVWTASFLIFYQTRQYAMAHNLTYLCVVSSFYWALSVRDNPGLRRNWLMLGASVGMLLVTRYQAALYLFFPFCVAVSELWRRRASLKWAWVCLLAIFAPVALQLLSWKLLYGSWLLYTYQGEGFFWSQPQVFKSLFDANHGLFYWHPIFLLGCFGMILFAVSRKNSLYWLWLLSLVTVTYLNAAWHCWWYGVSFGGRAYEGVTLFAFFGVAELMKRSENWPLWGRGVFISTLLSLAVWNIAVLEVTIYSWQTGVGLQGAETYSDLWNAIRHRFLW